MDATLGAGIAAIVACAATFPIRRHARTLGLLDLPGERSSHRTVTPRGGGVAIILGTAIALVALGMSGAARSPAWTVFGAAAAVGAVGLLDDRFGLPPLVRLVAQIVGATVIVATFGPLTNLPLPPPLDTALPVPVVGWALSLLWIVAAINFFNFMDGIDGLAAGQATASCLGVVAAAWSTDASALSLAAGAACLGFLYHNAPPARVFMGDSGSGFLGFLLAAIPFLAPAPRRSNALLAVAIGLTLFLVDPVVTLLRRALARKNILRAHREHLYQQLVAPDEPAGRVTAAYTAAAVLLALLGAYGYRSPSMFWVGCAGGAVAFYAVWRRARLVTRARSSQRPVTG